MDTKLVGHIYSSAHVLDYETNKWILIKFATRNYLLPKVWRIQCRRLKLSWKYNKCIGNKQS